MNLKYTIILILLSFHIKLLKSESICGENEFCIRLCCSDGKPCADLSLLPKDKELQPGYKVINGKPCSNPLMSEDDEIWKFLPDGKIEATFIDGIDEEQTVIFNHEEYCIPEIKANETINYLYCEETNEDLEKVRGFYPYLMLASIPFLLATLFVYGCVKELRSLHGKCLMSYCLGLTFLYLGLVTVEKGSGVIMEIKWLCNMTGYMTYMSVLVCFLWLNVMCHDIWSTFRTNCGLRRNDRRRFLFYCLYAFGVPALICLLVFITNQILNIPKKYQIGIGEHSCFIQQSRIANAIYLFTPIASVLILNIIFYSITAYKIFKVQREISVVQKGENGRHSKTNLDKARFFLYLRLFIVMGVIWVVELVSFMLEDSLLLHITSILNCLQGIGIFFLFIWKPKVKELMKRRCSSSWTNSTSFRRQFSRTDSSVMSQSFSQAHHLNTFDKKPNAYSRQNSELDTNFEVIKD